MSDMFSALCGAGLVSERVLREAEAQQLLDIEEESSRLKRDAGERERRLDILRTTNSAQTFRFEAHKLLLTFPELIGEIISLVHDQRGLKTKPGGGRLVAQLLTLRNDLRHHAKSIEEKVNLIKVVLPKK